MGRKIIDFNGPIGGKDFDDLRKISEVAFHQIYFVVNIEIPEPVKILPIAGPHQAHHVVVFTDEQAAQISSVLAGYPGYNSRLQSMNV